MDKQKQILEIAEVIAKYISSRDFEVKFITNPKSKAFPFSHTAGVAEDLYNAGYRKIPENAVVLTRGEYEKLCCSIGVSREEVDRVVDLVEKDTRKETAERFASLVEFHSVSTIDENGIEQFTISALGLKEILHEEFGIPYEEIYKEITDEN